MKNKMLFVVALGGIMSLANLKVSAASAEIELNSGYIDPTLGQGGPHRGPVLVPELNIEDYTLTFSTPRSAGFAIRWN